MKAWATPDNIHFQQWFGVGEGWFVLSCSLIYFCGQICWAVVTYNAIFKHFLSTHPIDWRSAASPGVESCLQSQMEQCSSEKVLYFGRSPGAKSSVVIQSVALPSYAFPTTDCHVWCVTWCYEGRVSVAGEGVLAEHWTWAPCGTFSLQEIAE